MVARQEPMAPGLLAMLGRRERQSLWMSSSHGEVMMAWGGGGGVGGGRMRWGEQASGKDQANMKQASLKQVSSKASSKPPAKPQAQPQVYMKQQASSKPQAGLYHLGLVGEEGHVDGSAQLLLAARGEVRVLDDL
jgi:hypothetical protein